MGARRTMWAVLGTVLLLPVGALTGSAFQPDPGAGGAAAEGYRFSYELVLPLRGYQTAQVSNGGTIAGRVIYKGRVPIRRIIPTKDEDVCGKPREEPRIGVGPDDGVRQAGVLLQGVAEGKAWPARFEGKPVLDNKDCRFVPQIQLIRAGEIDIVNSDPVLHNTHGFYGRRTAFNVGLPNQDQRVTKRLPRPGIVRVECDEHGWMLGWIYVVENPYAAVSGNDGSFTLTDVPPGDYTLVAAHGFTGPQTTKVTVQPGQTTNITIELER